MRLRVGSGVLDPDGEPGGEAPPGWTRGAVPAARAAVGPVIGSRQTNSVPGGANTWAWS